jgi:hypothetical protein
VLLLPVGLVFFTYPGKEVRAVGVTRTMTQHDRSDDTSYDPRLQLRVALALAGITLSELWLSYFALTGGVRIQDLEDWLLGVRQLPPLQVDLVALAADELLKESGYDLRVSPESS